MWSTERKCPNKINSNVTYTTNVYNVVNIKGNLFQLKYFCSICVTN